MSDERRKRGVQNDIEETFHRYESEEEAPPLPRLEEEAPAPQTERPAPTPRVVPTRIPGLDSLMGGGLPSFSLVLLLGEIGSGYGTFLSQVLYNHLSEGRKAAHYTAEASAQDVEGEMDSYGWSVRPFVEGGQLVFVDVLTPDLQELAELAPRGFTGLRVNLAGSLNTLKTDLLEKIREERWTVLHLSHLLHTYQLREVMELLLYWRAAIRAYGGVHFAVLPSGVHPEASENALKNVADGVVEFGLREGPRDYEGVLVIRKLRGLRTARMATYAITEEGIAIETAERIR